MCIKKQDYQCFGQNILNFCLFALWDIQKFCHIFKFNFCPAPFPTLKKYYCKIDLVAQVTKSYSSCLPALNDFTKFSVLCEYVATTTGTLVMLNVNMKEWGILNLNMIMLQLQQMIWKKHIESKHKVGNKKLINIVTYSDPTSNWKF